MQTSTCFIFLTLVSVNMLLAGTGFAQKMEEKKITVEFHNEPLSSALRKIEKLSGFHIAYAPELVAKYKGITLGRETQTVAAVLRTILASTNFDFSQDGNTILLFQRENPTGQSAGNGLTTEDLITVRGLITSEQGYPLAGATIGVEKTRMVKTTNAMGEFELVGVASDALLVVSYVGYESEEIPVNGRGRIDIRLKTSAKSMEEVNVVTTGYQMLPKERATGSFSVISGKQLQQVPTPSIYDMLEGKLPGVFVSTRRSASTNRLNSSNISIRGKNSYSIVSDNVPLIVIDGFPYLPYGSEDILSTVNPDDIESVDVLKDAAAASIWGSSAANGVIVITTKKGRRNGRTSISFSSTLGVTDAPRLQYLRQMNSGQYIGLEQEMVTKGIIANPFSYAFNSNPDQAQTVLFNFKNGTITQAQRDAQLAVLSLIDNNSQISKYLLQNAATQQYSLSLSGGGQNNTYYISGYYYQDMPVYRSNVNKGWNLTANNSYFLLNNRVTLTAGLSYIGSKDKYNATALNTLGNSTYGFHRYDNLVDSNGGHTQYSFRFAPAVLSKYENLGYQYWRYSPIDELYYSNTINNTDVLRLNMGLTGRVTDWLTLEGLGNFEKRFNTSTLYNEPGSYAARDLVNYATSINTTGALVYGIPQGGILSTFSNPGHSYSLRGQFDINKSWQLRHSFNMIGGAEIREVISQNNQEVLYGYNQALGTSSAYNQVATYTTVTGGLGLLGNGQSATSTTNRFLSYYGNASYAYLDRYILSGSTRFDDYNLLGVSRKKRAQPLWSAGAKWDLCKEAFLNKSKWIDVLAARVTYGFNGQAPRGANSSAVINVNSVNDPVTNLPAASISSPANPNLGWEKTRVVNYGLDFAILHRRLSGTIEYYTKKTTGIIYNEPINATYGFSTLTFNSGSTKGHGWDIKLTGIPVGGKDWEWTSTFIFSFNTNKVTDAKLNTLAVASATGSIPYLGYPMDYLFVYRWAGLDSTGESQVYAADGKTVIGKNTTITDFKALKYAGRTTAPFFGGFVNSFRYKSWELGVQISWYMGNVFLRHSIDNYPSSGFYSGFVGKEIDLANRWKIAGDEAHTNVPSLTGMNSNSSIRYKYSDILVDNGGYIRLQQVSLAYGLPAKWLGNGMVKSIQLSGTIRNLGLIWRGNKDGLDPAYLAQSTSINDLPPSTNYVFRLSANF